MKYKLFPIPHTNTIFNKIIDENLSHTRSVVKEKGGIYTQNENEIFFSAKGHWLSPGYPHYKINFNISKTEDHKIKIRVEYPFIWFQQVASFIGLTLSFGYLSIKTKSLVFMALLIPAYVFIRIAGVTMALFYKPPLKKIL